MRLYSNNICTEPTDRKWVCALLASPNLGTVIDIGVGEESTILVEYSEVFASVIGFEPHRYAYNMIRPKTSVKDNITVYNTALSSKQESVIFYSCTNNSGLSGVRKPRAREEFTTHILETMTLDDFPLNVSGKIDKIKIDAEGADVNILFGARNTIIQHTPFIQIEHDAFNVGHDSLIELGYTEIIPPHPTNNRFYYHTRHHDLIHQNMIDITKKGETF